jgi:hypothetical protein
VSFSFVHLLRSTWATWFDAVELQRDIEQADASQDQRKGSAVRIQKQKIEFHGY